MPIRFTSSQPSVGNEPIRELALTQGLGANETQVTLSDSYLGVTLPVGQRLHPYLTVMAPSICIAPRAHTIELSTATLVDLSLRNHLCFFSLRTEHGTAYHLGTIVRTMFASFFLFEAGFGISEMSLFSEVDIKLGEAILSKHPERPWSLKANALEPTARLLRLYDSQLQTAPLIELVAAHQRAELNFQAPPHERLSIAALVQRSKLDTRHTALKARQRTDPHLQ